MATALLGGNDWGASRTNRFVFFAILPAARTPAAEGAKNVERPLVLVSQESRKSQGRVAAEVARCRLFDSIRFHSRPSKICRLSEIAWSLAIGKKAEK